MSGKVDLHLHTYFSDGTLSPQEVVREAKAKGFTAIAITDHDSVDGIPLAEAAGKKIGLEIVPAVELTAEEDDTEIHILGYFINYKDKKFEEFLKDLRQQRIERTFKMVSKLRKLGLDITMEDVLKTAGLGAIGRLHLASCLKKKGYVRNIYEAFARYLGDGRSAYVKKKRLPPKEAIRIIESLGGVSILAHPHTLKNREMVEKLIQVGISGMEVYHSDHSSAQSKAFLKLVKEHNLVGTGGSDCHGLGKGRILLGTVAAPYTIVEELRKRAKRNE